MRIRSFGQINGEYANEMKHAVESVLLLTLIDQELEVNNEQLASKNVIEKAFEIVQIESNPDINTAFKLSSDVIVKGILKDSTA